jgi:peptide/nickel transport system substrate-binding protein
VQFKPEFVKPTALLDLRVRRALAHVINRQGLADGLLDSQGIPADTLVSPQVEYFPALDRALSKYPYDVRRGDELMRDAGFEMGADGFYSSAGSGRFALEISVSGLPQNEAEAAVIVDSLRRAGVDASIQVLSQAQAIDRQLRSSFSGLSSTSNTNAFEPPVRFLRASEIPTPENRWRGSNRGGWNHPEFERLTEAYDTTLDRAQRNQRIVDLLKVVSSEVPAYPLYYNFAVQPYVADLRGPLGGINWNWNLPEWEWT